jgi:hypothetical protein
MDYSGYISDSFNNNVKHVSLGNSDYHFFVNSLLNWELFFGPFSVYNVHRQLRKSGTPIAYKNVHQKLHKILALGLIKETREVFAEHGAKYYKISLNGWFNLILEGAFFPDYIYELVIRHNYDSNIIFRTFLSSFFELETLSHLDSLDVNTYLQSCCQSTVSGIQVWKHDIERPKLIPDSIIGGAACPFPRRKGKEYTAMAIVNLKDNRQINRTEFSHTNTRLLADGLDLLVNSFLFQQTMKYSGKKEMQTILSNDKKFVASIQNVKKEFHRSYEKLFP